MIRSASFGLVVVFLTAVPTAAGTYWVSPTGAASWAAAESTTPLSGKACCSLDTANRNAVAGDTIFLRGGTYTDQVIRPNNSGERTDRRITFAGHKDESQAVMFEESNGIIINGCSFITVTGMEFRSMKLFFRIQSGTNNIISHCLFDGRSKTSREWAGAAIRSNRNQPPSHHNYVHHCRFYRFAYKDARPNRGAILDVGNLNNGTGENGCTHNRIEHNEFAYGGHHTLGVYSRYNVIRFNYIHNETNPDEWDFPGYRGAVTQGTSGGYCLYEGNRFGFSDQAGIGLRSPKNILRRNLFYHNAQGGIQVVTNAVGKDRADDNAIYHNTFFHNGHRSKFPAFQGGMYFASWSRVTPKRNVVRNNLFFDNRNGEISYDRPTDPQTIENNWSNRKDPHFVDSSGLDPTVTNQPNLTLKPTSPARDEGGWLTTVAGKSGRGNSFRLADSRCFTDGWGVITGDSIQLETETEPATITQLDSDTHTITLDRVVNFKKGQGVALAYSGTAPDPGAFELASRQP